MNNKILIVIGILSLLLIGCSSTRRLEGKVMRISEQNGYVVLDSINRYVAVCPPVNHLLREGDFVILTKSSADMCYDLEKLN